MWFHVDNLSSAHIYVRLPEGQDWESIDNALLADCAQLTKANSIEGEFCSFFVIPAFINIGSSKVKMVVTPA